MTRHLHHANCGCMTSLSRGGLSRRGLFGLGVAGALTAALPALASGGNYDRMLVNCIDPRFTTFNFSFMASKGFKDLYSQFSVAGGPIGIVAPVFADWQKTFWDNLDITVKLHHVSRVVGLTHRDCGAAEVAYGERIKTDRVFETQKHTEALGAFRAEVGKHHPELGVDTGIMALDGMVEVVT